MQPFQKQILCVEDDLDTSDLLSFWLTQNGYEVKAVETKSDALRLAQQGPYDLYLLDDWLPDGRGKDMIAEIRNFDPDTPIVFISGDTREGNQAEILRLGAQVFLAKPMDLDLVAETIGELITTYELSN